MMLKQYLSKIRSSCLWVTLLLLATAPVAQGQYFGRNKAQYKKLDFQVMETPHFEIYHYLQDKKLLNQVGRASERWYKRHQVILDQRFKELNPVILYKHHADFQQTSVVSGLIGTGTGGVTEGLRNRVVMPLTASNAQTDHVLGHELVHAFQYHMLINGDGTSLQSMNNIPLWMVEGLAEYMSLGRVDAHTAMWLRDAVRSNDIPSLDDLTRKQYKYFPYRYGQAVWAFLAGLHGDTFIGPLFRQTGMHGYNDAFRNLLGYDAKTVSGMWKTKLKDYYGPLMNDTMATVGRKLVADKDAGDLNISPAFSPDGKYVVFLSEKNVLSTDFYLADAKTGRIIKKVSSRFQRSHIDDISFLESAGTWSPDSKQFAFIVFAKGSTNLLILDIERDRTVGEISIPGVEYLNHAAWSPDGKHLLVSGLVEGRSDLFLYNLDSKKVERLTNDAYSDIQPVWHPDGQRIIFASDRGPDTDLSKGIFNTYRICLLDLVSRKIDILPIFPGADNLNPQPAPDGQSLYFLSNADGFRNLYEYNLAAKQVFKLTKYFTGISGITPYSPAMSVAQSSRQLVYNVFRQQKYILYSASLDDFIRIPVNPDQVDLRAATLPPAEKSPKNLVGRNLAVPAADSVVTSSGHFVPVLSDTSRFISRPYQPKFSLSYIGASGGIGVTTGRQGPGLAGGVSTLFSDILNNHQLFGALSLNGEIYDLGGQVAYLNQKHKLNWGASVGHIPYRSGRYFVTPDTIQVKGESVLVDNVGIITQRLFEDQVNLFSSYAFSQTRRLEGSLSYSRYSSRVDLMNNYYLGNRQIGYKREKLEGPAPFSLASASVAWVGDNSTFGLTSPLIGHRFRFQLEKTVGTINMHTALLDYRKYFFTKPIGFAFRTLHYGRFGRDSERLYPLFIGNEFYVRGYNTDDLYQQNSTGGNFLTVNQLIGSRLSLLNAEMRMPLTGPEKLTPLKSGLLFSDLVVFADAGLAWGKNRPVKFDWKVPAPNVNIPVYSVGASLRLNLFGYMVVEPYVALPFQRYQAKPHFGIFFSGGGW